MVFRAAALLSTAVVAQQPTVNVPNLGTVNGVLSSHHDGVADFLGIPYAKPPVGDLRWQPPVPFGTWDSPRDATKFGFSCPQQPGLASQPLSEDCLFLNIGTPSAQLTSDEKLPVMFWIHGGSYLLGDAASYPTGALVAGSDYKVVVVATNYRLGVLGYSASADLMKRSSDGSAGNFGLQDQRLAMVWVKDHISSFGGDASQVTIFGESAGGNAVLNQLAFPASAGLFHRAILESATYNAGSESLADAETRFAKVKSNAGCDDLDCMLAVNSSTMSSIHVQGIQLLAYPVVDGVAQLTGAETNVRQGNYQKVDVLLGSNRDELALFVGPVLPKNLTDSELEAFLLVLVKNPLHISKLKKLYDPATYEYPQDLAGYSQNWWKAVRMGTDGGGLGLFTSDESGVFALGHCAARHLARDLKAGGSAKVFQYLFERGSVVKHGDEIGYVFGDVDAFTQDADKELASKMAKYWSSFAINGVPGAEGLPEWPEYTLDGDEVLRLDAGSGATPSGGDIRIGQKLRADACEYWQAHPVYLDPNIITNLIPVMGMETLDPYYGHHEVHADGPHEPLALV